MSFILSMAWRDSRASRRRLLLYSSSIVLGIAALVSIGSFTANVRDAIDAEAKALLGADLMVTSPAPAPARVEELLRARGASIAHEKSFSSMMTFPKEGRLRLVQVHAIEGGFPFYGKLETEPEGAAARLDAGSILLEPTLLAQYGLSVGDPVKLGRSVFTVTGVLKKVPGESPAVSMMAPRAYIAASALAATGLLEREALARYRLSARFGGDADTEAVAKMIREEFKDARLGVETVGDRKRSIGQALEHFEGFLSLTGFIALVLGAIGVASALHSHVREKLSTVAVLRCLGASGGEALAVYVVQGIAVGLAGALAGAACGVALQRLLPLLAKGFIPLPIVFSLSWPDVAKGMLTGVAISLVFSLLPLLAVRRVPPLAALRSSFAERQDLGPDPLRWAAFLVVAAAVVGLALFQARDLRVGIGFAVMLGFGFASLAALALGIQWAARRLAPRGLPYAVRQGIANLHRPNNRTALLLLALGMGSFLVLTMVLVRTTLLKEVRGIDAAGRPNLVFFDIQEDQMKGVEELAGRAGSPVAVQAPIVTMKLTAIKGRSVEALLAEKDTRLAAWALRREYRSTYRSSLSSTEKITAGTWQGRADPAAGAVPISVEEGLARDLHLSLGDLVTWDVQGVPLMSRVASLRAVEWRRLEPNFFVVFPDGALEAAPKTFVEAVHADGPDRSAAVQSSVVGAYPNVTAIDLALVVETLDGIFSKIAFAVEFMALFTVVTGLVVLAGSITAGRYQRMRESVLLRTLGASRSQIAAIHAVEYAVLGIQGGLAGALFALIANTLLARFVFHLAPAFPVGVVLGGVACVAVLTVATGLASGRGLARTPPLAVIRQDI